MKRKCLAGITSVALPIFVQDTTSTTGGGLGSLVFNTAGLVAEYRRQGQSAWTAITLVAGTLGTYLSGSFIADGALTGAYEFCPPDAAVASGARWVNIRLRGAANMLPVLIEIELDAVNYQDATRFGLGALPNVAAGASGGLGVYDSTLLMPSRTTKWGASANSLPMSVAGYPVVSANNLETQAQADALAALTGGTNTIFVDVSHRVKALDSGGNTFTNLQDLYTGTGTNAKFTVPALSNGPTSAGGTNVNVISLSAGALAQIAANGTGTGDTNVDHSSLDVNGDNLIVEEMGEGLGNATVDAYLKSEWDADQSAAVLRGRTSTRDDGTWVDSLRLFSGLTYYVKAYREGDTEKMTKTVLVP